MGTFDVVIAGHTLSGFARETVLPELAALFNQPPEVLSFLLEGRPTTIKRQVDARTAGLYVSRLRGLGVDCRAEPATLDIELDAFEPRQPPSDQRFEAKVARNAQRLSDHVTELVGLERLDGFSLKTVFGQAFSKHDESEMEAHFAVGTATTTPPLGQVSAAWPNPWMFLRLLTMALLVYGVFWVSWTSYENLNLIPGLIMVGSFAVPIATLVFFFEMNTPRNISLYQVMRLVFLGGAISLLFSLIAYDASQGISAWVGAPIAGIIEESAKLAALVFVTRNLSHERFRYVLNGLLIGAAVGTGFAAFESAGYALQFALLGGAHEMNETIIARGLLSPFAHIAWTALAGGALWKVRAGRPFSFEMLHDKDFYSVFALVVVLHAIWNMPFTGPLGTKYAVLGFVAWVAIFSLIQTGLAEIRRMKESVVAAR